MEGFGAFQRLTQGFQRFGDPDIWGPGHEAPEVIIGDEQRPLRLELLRRVPLVGQLVVYPLLIVPGVQHQLLRRFRYHIAIRSNC